MRLRKSGPDVSISHVAQYVPQSVRRVVAVAHGSPWPDGSRSEQEVVDYTWSLLDGWRDFADAYGVAIVLPPLGSPRFADYRGWPVGSTPRPDEYLNDVVDQLIGRLGLDPRAHHWSLFGHSAGAQFAARFVLLHARRLAATVISAAQTYPFPSAEVRWPYGRLSAPVRADWVAAASTSPISVCVGSDDVEPHPPEAGQIGTTRLDRATAWVEAMRRLAVDAAGIPQIDLFVAPGVDHDEIQMSICGQQRLAVMWQLPD